MVEQRFDYDDASRVCDYLVGKLEERSRSADGIEEGLNLGSGLGGFAAQHMEESKAGEDSGPVEVSFREVFEHLNQVGGRPSIAIAGHAVKGHAQKLIIGHLEGTDDDRLVIAQSGREHPYEGVSTRRATFWLRVMQLLGAKAWIGSNASGILTPDTLSPPAIMLVESDRDEGHDNPLIGLNDDRFGPRFPHMSEVYPKSTLDLFERVAAELEIDMKRGMYIRRMGPNYERPEDVYAYRALLRRIWEEAASQSGEVRFKGGVTGVVGMSSTYEAQVAQHAGQSNSHPAFRRGRGLVSVSTNYSASLGPNSIVAPSNHDEVAANARIVEEVFGKLVRGVILEMRGEDSPRKGV